MASERDNILPYEPAMQVVYDPDSVRLTHVAGPLTAAAWLYYLVWLVLPEGYGLHGGAGLAALCLLPVVTSSYLIGALLSKPTWWYTRVVGVALALLWAMLCVTGIVAFVRLALSVNWLVLPL